jgi:helix-turn-helix protein
MPKRQPKRRPTERRSKRDERSDVPYMMKLPDGRGLYVEVPGRYAEQDRSGRVAFTPEGVRFLDRVRALALPLDTPPRPAFISNVRQALGMTQTEFGDAVGVDKMTVFRWERGTTRPGSGALQRLRRLIARAKRRGTLLAG